MKILILSCCFLLLSLNSYAEYRIVSDKDEKIVHIHSIEGGGIYQYTKEEDLARFGFDKTYSIAVFETLPSEAAEYLQQKISAMEQEEVHEKKIAARIKKNQRNKAVQGLITEGELPTNYKQ